MGTDIRTHVEIREGKRWQYVRYTHPLAWRNYGLFGFLADVRNYSHVPTIVEPRGLPEDASVQLREEWVADVPDAYCASWLLLSELLRYDYDTVFWDRRITRETSPGSFDGAALAHEGEGQHLTLREFLGPHFFSDLDQMAMLAVPSDVRLIFWFD